MAEIKAIQIGDNQYIYVETETDADVDQLPRSNPTGEKGWQRSGPQYSTPTGPVDNAIDALTSLQQNIKILAQSVSESFQENPPQEWSLELNIGFKGKTNPIPVILSGEASGALKVTAKWRRD